MIPSANQGLTVDRLYQALTRPATQGGVPSAAWILEFLIVVEAFLISKNLLALLAFLPLHALSWMLCLNEPRIFDLLMLWGRTRGPGWLGNLPIYKANSYSPNVVDLAQFKARRPRDVTVIIDHERLAA